MGARRNSDSAFNGRCNGFVLEYYVFDGSSETAIVRRFTEDIGYGCMYSGPLAVLGATF